MLYEVITHVMAFQPAGGREMLWISPKTLLQDGVPIRGGIYQNTIIRSATPLPCLGDELVCVWAETAVV